MYRTSDAGASWTKSGQLPAGYVVNDIVTQDLPAGTALLSGGTTAQSSPAALPAAGLYVISDYGTQLEARPSFLGLNVTAIAVAPSDPNVIYASIALQEGVPSSPLFKSIDGGTVWTPLPVSVPLNPTRLAVDTVDPQVLWVNSVAGSSPVAGLWVSTDGGVSFVLVRQDAVEDLDAAPLGGGGTRLDAATTEGIVRTRDQGTSFSTLQDGTAISTIAHEAAYPRVLMAVVGGAPMRSLDEGTTFKPTGFPSVASCTADISRDDGSPSVFVLSLSGCDKAGHYLYLSDGRDIVGQQPGSDGPSLGSLLGPTRRAIPMRVLAEVPLPMDDPGISGSVAFDGTSLYFTGSFEEYPDSGERIFQMSVNGELTGSFKPYVLTPVLTDVYGNPCHQKGCDRMKKEPIQVVTLTYDAKRNLFWSVAGGGEMYRIDPETHRATSVSVGKAISHTIAADPVVGGLFSFAEQGSQIYENPIDDEFSNFETRCEVSDPHVASASPYGPFAGAIAGGIPAGDGTYYLQMEDDVTVLHISSNCETLAVYQHRLFVEAPNENDQIACDSVTFGEPAIWLHDADYGMVAYAAPGAYCPVPTELAIVPEKSVGSSGLSTTLCAVLTAKADGRALPAEPIRFYVGNRYIGQSVSDGGGRACIPYTPSQIPGSRLDVHGAFLGDPSYLPSQADGRLLLKPGRPVPREVTPLIGLGMLPPTPPLLPPTVQPQPNPGPAPAAATAPAPAPAPAQAPAAQANAVAVAQRQEQPQMAFVYAAQQLKEQAGMQNAMLRVAQQRSDPLAATKFVLSMSALSMMLAFGLASATARHFAARRVGR